MKKQTALRILKDCLTEKDLPKVKQQADWVLCETLLNRGEHHIVTAWIEVMDRLQHLREEGMT
jgi:hypothetical protein